MVRPEFKPTAAMRKQVAIAAGAGMAHVDIALGLGIARNTLEKHFAVELSTGAAGKRLQVLGAMFKSAVGGNVAAQKAYISLTPNLDPPPPEKPAKPETKGKKEQAKEDAVTAAVGTDWDSLLPGGAPVQ